MIKTFITPKRSIRLLLLFLGNLNVDESCSLSQHTAKLAQIPELTSLRQRVIKYNGTEQRDDLLPGGILIC